MAPGNAQLSGLTSVASATPAVAPAVNPTVAPATKTPTVAPVATPTPAKTCLVVPGYTFYPHMDATTRVTIQVGGQCGM